MPLVQVFRSEQTKDPDDASNFLRRVTEIVAAELGKDPRWVMVNLMPAIPMSMGGEPGPTAYFELKSIGQMSEAQTAKLSAALCTLIRDECEVPIDRVYIEFKDAERHLWGWNAQTFA